MHMEHVSLIGWVHTLTCTAAIFFGAWNIFATKGTALHRGSGFTYIVSMLIGNAAALAVFHGDIALNRPPQAGPGIFGLFHWFAVLALVFTLLGWLTGRNHRLAINAYAHPLFMVLSYYLLIGGVINELFGRLDVLRPFAVHLIDGQHRFGSAAVSLSQALAMLATLVVILLFLAKVWRYRHRPHLHARLTP